jgi:hypothetical protein
MAAPATTATSSIWLRRRIKCLMFLLALALTLRCAPAGASEPILTVLKNTLLGSATGLILSGAATLVVHDEDRADVVRWGVVVGTFGGFALGVVRAIRGDEDVFGAMERAVPSGEGGVLSPLARAAIASDCPRTRIHPGPPRSWLATADMLPPAGDDACGSVVILGLAASPGGTAR